MSERAERGPRVERVGRRGWQGEVGGRERGDLVCIHTYMVYLSICT
jgi:hypothetical protein